MVAVLILHGPNLNLTGKREPEIYGRITLDEIDASLVELGTQSGVEVRTLQSNSEGVLIDALHDAMSWADGVLINPGGYTHSSVALRDAITAIGIPVIEVHLSNIFSREEFRQKSVTLPACVGLVAGFGKKSYELAFLALLGLFGM